MNRTQKGDGFPGQRIVVLPRAIVASAMGQPLLQGLFPTDAGFFPKASGHLRERSEGAGQAILIYCARGGGWCEIAGNRHEVAPGDLLVIPPATPHAYGANDDQPWSIHWVHAQGALVPWFLIELGIDSEHPLAPVGEDSQVLSLFEELQGTLEHGYAPTQLLYASQTLGHLLATMVVRRRENWRGAPDPHQKVTRSLSYMKQHLDKPLRLDNLASLANLSPSHFNALFRQHTGFACIEYLIRLRMHRAAQLLDTTPLSVKNIASQVGYQDQLYFSRLFRNVNGVSPSEYRSTRKG